MSHPAIKSNQPAHFFLIFVMLVNLLAGLVQPGTILAAAHSTAGPWPTPPFSAPAATSHNLASLENSKVPDLPDTNSVNPSLALASSRALAVFTQPEQVSSLSQPAGDQSAAKADPAYGKLPLAFEENQGRLIPWLNSPLKAGAIPSS